MKRFLETNHKTVGSMFIALAIISFILQISVWMNKGEQPKGTIDTFFWLLDYIWGIALTIFFIIMGVKSFERELFK